MLARPIIKNLLLFFVVFSVGYLVGKEVGLRRAASPDEGAAANAVAPARQLVAYYFHGAKRCVTCNKIEAYGHETITREFPDALASGRIAWKVVNKDEPRNEHFVGHYGLTASALVLADMRHGEEDDFANLKRVWDLVDDKPAFQAYVGGAIEMYLEDDEAEDEEEDGGDDDDAQEAR